MTAITVSSAISSGRSQLVNTRQRSLIMARLRVLWVLAAFAVLAVAALLRIAYLGVVEDAPRGMSMYQLLLPPRGEIADRNGVPLARAFPAYSLWYNPAALDDGGAPLVKSPQQVARELVRIFPDMDVHDLTRRLQSGRAGYLRRRVLPEDANRIQEIGELALEIPQETERFYPQGSMASHVLGYVAADGHGRVGMEAVLDKDLLDPARRATPAVLLLDLRGQGALEEELKKGMLATEAVGAAGIVLDVDTGEVLALASLPAFDPNRIDAAGQRNMFNRVTNQVYELGSTFKPLTVAAAIDAGVVTDLSRRYQANRPLEIGGFQIRDSHTIGASLNVPEALIHSSNIVTAQIADALVSPLQLASGVAAMVNGGIWRPATLRKVEPGKAAKGRRVFKASTSARMNQLLRMIAVYGTGRNADAPGFRVGGKTGSAEKPGAGGYRRSTLVSTFAAAFPMDRPRYVVIAMLDEPKGTAASSYQRTAAWNAAPIVGKVVPRIGPLLGIRPDDTRDIDLSDLKPLVHGGVE